MTLKDIFTKARIDFLEQYSKYCKEYSYRPMKISTFERVLESVARKGNTLAKDLLKEISPLRECISYLKRLLRSDIPQMISYEKMKALVSIDVSTHHLLSEKAGDLVIKKLQIFWI